MSAMKDFFTNTCAEIAINARRKFETHRWKLHKPAHCGPRQPFFKKATIAELIAGALQAKSIWDWRFDAYNGGLHFSIKYGFFDNVLVDIIETCIQDFFRVIYSKPNKTDADKALFEMYFGHRP